MAIARAESVRAPDDRLRVIGVGFDARRRSRAALHLAEQLALEHGATMRVYSVIPAHAHATRAGSSRRARSTARYSTKSLGAQLQRRGHRRSTAASGRRPSVIRGDPVEELADASRQGLDLLVVGSRRQGALQPLCSAACRASSPNRADCPAARRATSGRGANDTPAAVAEIREPGRERRGPVLLSLRRLGRRQARARARRPSCSPGRRALVVHVWGPLGEVAAVPPVPGLEGLLKGGLDEMDRLGEEISAKLCRRGL